MSDKNLEDKISNTYDSHPAHQKIQDARLKNQGIVVRALSIIDQAMTEAGAVDKEGNPDYKKLDNLEISKKVGKIAEKKEMALYAGKSNLSEEDQALFYQIKTGRPVGRLTETLMQRGSSWRIEEYIQQVRESEQRSTQEAAQYHFRDISQDELQKYLGLELNEIPTQSERTRIAQVVAMNRNDEIVKSIANQYIKKDTSNYKKAA